MVYMYAIVYHALQPLLQECLLITTVHYIKSITLYCTVWINALETLLRSNKLATKATHTLVSLPLYNVFGFFYDQFLYDVSIKCH